MPYELKDVLIELTKRCNLSCLHCGSSCDGVAPEKELDSREWIMVIDALARMNVKKIIFSGGEPTLLAALPRLISAAHHGGLKYGLITNGFSMDDRLVRAMQNYPPFGVGVSVDGPGDVHNGIRRHERSWQHATQTILQLQDAGVRVCAVTTLSEMNLSSLARLADLLGESLKVDCWQLQLAMPAGRMRSQKNLLIDEADFKKICSDILAFKRRYPKMQIEAADCFGMAQAGTIRTEAWSGCGAGISGMAIDATGRIMPCLSLRGHYCGRVTDGVDVVWKNSAGFDFNRKFDPNKVPGRGKEYEYSVAGKCGRCDLLVSCRGGCASQSYFTHGHFHDSPFCYYRSFSQLSRLSGKKDESHHPPAGGILDEPSQVLYKYGLPESSPNSGTFDPGEIIIKYGLPEDMRPPRWPERPRPAVTLYKYGLPSRGKRA